MFNWNIPATLHRIRPNVGLLAVLMGLTLVVTSAVLAATPSEEATPVCSVE